jgi:hypothetical protein
MSATIILTEKAALDLKYTRLTESYTLPREQWMIDNVCADMRRGGIDHAIVMKDGEATVWRKSKRAMVGNV